MKGRIAILVPTYNGGALLAETVASAARAGLPAESYAVLVCDNVSTDGSLDQLGDTDAQGAPIIIKRNEENLGRVPNWNRVIEHARALGFSHALFLMVGDMIKGTALIALRDRMVQADAALGLAPYLITDENLQPLRLARRIRWSGESIDHRSFLAGSLAAGALLYGPLGANLYRLGDPVSLRFDPADETHTDQLATALFAHANAARIVYLDQPVSCWRSRPGRFHSTMTPDERLKGDLRVIERGCRAAKVAPDYTKIRASLLLRTLFHRRGGLAAAWTQSKLLTQSAPPSWLWLAGLLWRQAVFKTPWRVEAR